MGVYCPSGPHINEPPGWLTTLIPRRQWRSHSMLRVSWSAPEERVSPECRLCIYPREKVGWARSHAELALSLPLFSGAMGSFPSHMLAGRSGYTNHHQPRISATRLLGDGGGEHWPPLPSRDDLDTLPSRRIYLLSLPTNNHTAP